jgi:RNA polymerase primary sigma factor
VTTTRPRRVRSPFDVYLTEINDAPLLGADEERQLARRIADGDPAARDHLVRANLRLVVHLARAYVGKGLPLEDLIAEGNMGLVRAAEGFDPAAGTRFVTYATYWVRQSIRRALTRAGNPVRLPQYMWTLLGRWQRAAATLRRELGREATEEEIAADLRLTARQVRAVRQARKALASGQLPDEPEGAAPIEQVADGGEGCPAEVLASAEQLRVAVEALGLLSEREATVLRLRFGLDGRGQATLNQIGALLGYTRERVRQIEQEALAKLRRCVAA